MTPEADLDPQGTPPEPPEKQGAPNIEEVLRTVNFDAIFGPPAEPPTGDPPPAGDPPAADDEAKKLREEFARERVEMAREREAMQIDRAVNKLQSESTETEKKFMDVMLVKDQGKDAFLASAKRLQQYAKDVDGQIAEAEKRGAEKATQELSTALGRQLGQNDIIKPTPASAEEKEMLEKATSVDDLLPMLESRTDGFMDYVKPS